MGVGQPWLVKCSRDPGESGSSEVVDVGTLTAMVTTCGMMQLMGEEGTGGLNAADKFEIDMGQ